MISRPDHDALLLITHPGGARSFDYDDYWEGEELVYTGRGKRGNQRREGANRDLGDNAKQNLVFEPAGARRLRFLGRAECVQEWRSTSPDIDGNDRLVLRFRLRFASGAAKQVSPPMGEAEKPARSHQSERNPRPFDPSRPPKAPAAARGRRTAEETQALQEKATKGHHQLLTALSDWLTGRGWSQIEEIPLAIDLWARAPDNGPRVIFEAKTVAARSESARVRSALAQLLEYRFLYGEPDDLLCLVSNHPISDRRVRFLSELSVLVLWQGGVSFHPGSSGAQALVGTSRAQS